MEVSESYILQYSANGYIVCIISIVYSNFGGLSELNYVLDGE